MRTRLTVFCFAVLIGGLFHNVAAQGRIKGGIGYNFISNNFDDQYLGDYFAPSLHFSYALVRSPQFSLAVENATALRVKQTDERERVIVLSSFPLVGQYDWQKMGVLAGAGPAYLAQKSRDYQHNSSQSGFFLQTLAGVSLKGKPILGGFLYPEYQARLSFMKNIKDRRQDAGTLSILVFLRS